MAIDDPVDQLRKQTKHGADIFGVAMRAASTIPSALSPALALAEAVRGFFRERSQGEDVEHLFELISNDVRLHGLKIEEMQRRLDSDEAKEAIARTLDQLRLTFAKKKVARLASIISGTIASDEDARWQEAIELVQDVAQLGEADLLALEVLHRIQGRLVRPDGSMPIDAHRYNEEAGAVLDEARARDISKDAFYERCQRLVGFGLALPVQRGEAHMPPGDLAFQLSTRGHRLISLLGKQL